MSQIDFIRKKVDIELVEMLKGDGLLTETQYVMMQGQSILTENRHPYTIQVSGTPVSFDHFSKVWNDIDTYKDAIDVYNALAGGHNVQEGTKQRTINRLLSPDGQISGMGSEEISRLYSQIDYRSSAERTAAVKKLQKARAAAAARGVDPSSVTPETSERELEHRVDAGVRGRRSPTGNIEKLNNTDLFSGNLYADISRIPKRRWTQFFKIWQKKTQVRPNERSIAQMLSGVRKWEKTFIFGYEIDQTLRYELWYNSYDGFFTLHDANGNEVARHIRNISDALTRMFEYIRQTSHEDANFLAQQTPEFTRAERAIRNDAERKRQNAWDGAMQRAKEEETKFSRDAELAKRTGEKEIDSEEGKAISKNLPNKKPPVDKNRQAFQNSKKEIEKIIGTADEYEKQWNKNIEDFQKSIEDNDERQQAYKDSEQTKHRQKLQNKAASEAARELDLRDELFDITRTIEIRGSGATKKEKDRMEEIENELKKIKKNRTQRSRDRSAARENRVNESDIFSQFKDFALEENTIGDDVLPDGAEISMGDAQNLLLSRESESQVARFRQVAQQAEQKTMSTFSGEIEAALLSTYTETRMSDDASAFRRGILDRFRWFRGRKEELTLPSTGLGGRIKHLQRNLVYGGYYRADFIIGFSISNRVNFEIWYVQDINPYSKEMQGSFSVYDVNSKRLVRGGIKYYRQAALVAKEKLASPDISRG